MWPFVARVSASHEFAMAHCSKCLNQTPKLPSVNLLGKICEAIMSIPFTPVTKICDVFQGSSQESTMMFLIC